MAKSDDDVVPTQAYGNELPSRTPADRPNMGGQDTPNDPEHSRPLAAVRPGVTSPTLAGCLRTLRPTTAVPATDGEAPRPDAGDAGQTNSDHNSDPASSE